jgi:hypothetical protein
VFFLFLGLWIALILGGTFLFREIPYHRYWSLSPREHLALKIGFAVLALLSVFLYFFRGSNLFIAFFLSLITAGALSIIIYLRIREGRYLKKSTKEAMSDELRQEIKTEREENIRKQEKFQDILRRFGG